MTIAADILPYLVAIGQLATAVILAAGLVSMGSGGFINEKYSNLLMRWRVAIQGVTIGLAAPAVVFMSP